jgi:hypothetical protein
MGRYDKMNLGEIAYEGVDWFHLPQDAAQWLVLMNTVINLGIPSKPMNFLGTCATICFPRNGLLHGIGQ